MSTPLLELRGVSVDYRRPGFQTARASASSGRSASPALHSAGRGDSWVSTGSSPAASSASDQPSSRWCDTSPQR